MQHRYRDRSPDPMVNAESRTARRRLYQLSAAFLTAPRGWHELGKRCRTPSAPEDSSRPSCQLALRVLVPGTWPLETGDIVAGEKVRIELNVQVVAGPGVSNARDFRRVENKMRRLRAKPWRRVVLATIRAERSAGRAQAYSGRVLPRAG